MSARSEREGSTRPDQPPAGLHTRFDPYGVQEISEVAWHSGVTAAAKKSRSDSISGSDFHLVTMFVPQKITTERPSSSPVSLETSSAALLQACKSYL